MLGDRIKQIRKEKELSQQAFAAKLSTASGYISEIEKGKTMPGSAFLCSLKREFPEVDLNWLLTGKCESKVAEQQVAYGQKDLVDEEIMKTLQGMDEEKRRDVLKYATEKKQLMECLAQLRNKKTT